MSGGKNGAPTVRAEQECEPNSVALKGGPLARMASTVALVMSTSRPLGSVRCKVTGDGDAARTILMAGGNRVATRRADLRPGFSTPGKWVFAAQSCKDD
jgi:hypothetical protein